MRFRLVAYLTKDENRYSTEHRIEILGDRESIFNVWFTYAKELSYPHVYVYSLDGRRLEPNKGIHEMTDYSI